MSARPQGAPRTGLYACHKCGEKKMPEAFHHSNAYADGRDTTCAACERAKYSRMRLVAKEQPAPAMPEPPAVRVRPMRPTEIRSGWATWPDCYLPGKKPEFNTGPERREDKETSMTTTGENVRTMVVRWQSDLLLCREFRERAEREVERSILAKDHAATAEAFPRLSHWSCLERGVKTLIRTAMGDA